MSMLPDSAEPNIMRDDLYREIVQLREEVDALLEENRQLKKQLTPDIVFPRAWKLRPQETRFLACLSSAPDGFRSRRALHIAAAPNAYSDTDPNIVSVIATSLRKKLPPQVAIETSWGRGYYLNPDSRIFLAKAREAMRR